MVRRSPKEVVEVDKSPRKELQLIKYPREEPVDVSEKRRWGSVSRDDSKAFAIFKSHEKNPYYTGIHTHPYIEKHTFLEHLPFFRRFFLGSSSTLASTSDIYGFLLSGNQKQEVIQTRGTETGKVYDTLIIKKTAKTPKPSYFHINRTDLRKQLDQYGKDVYHSKGVEEWEKFKDLCKTYHLHFKLIKRGERTRNNIYDLEGALSIFLLIGSIFFLSTNFTGNIIGLQETTSNWIGGALFILGLFVAFFYFKRKV